MIVNRKNKWIWGLLIFFFLFPMIGLIIGDITYIQFFIRIGSILFVGLIYVVFIKVLNVNKQGALPWYGSPFLWLGIPALTVLLYSWLKIS
jgi:hypothetical protein